MTSSASAQTTLRQRAVSAAVAVLFRGVVVRVLAFVGGLVLARLLGPEQMGVLAIGMGLVLFFAQFANGGLGPALIRQAEAPSRVALRALTGLQLSLGLVVSALIAVCVAPLGETGRVTAIMTAALPFTAFQVAGAILLERELEFRRRVVVEIIENASFFGVAILASVLRAPLELIACAALARGLAGALAMWTICPAGRQLPSGNVRPVLSLLPFGLRFQAVAVISLARDQLLNLALLGLGGVGAVGVWSVAYRVLQVPFVLFEALWRVTFPAMARLRSVGGDSRRAIAKIAESGAVASALILTCIAGTSGHLLELLFGRDWAGTSLLVLSACAGLVVSGPISVAAAGFLYAEGEARVVLRATAWSGLSWLAVTVVLYPLFGVSAIGVAWMTASWLEAAMLARAVGRRVGFRLLPPVLKTAALASLATTVGLFAGRTTDDPAVSVAVGGTVAIVGCVLLLMLFQQQGMRETLRLIQGKAFSSPSRT